MTVKELIEILSKLPQENVVTVWDPYKDWITSKVNVDTEFKSGVVLITNT